MRGSFFYNHLQIHSLLMFPILLDMLKEKSVNIIIKT